MTSAAKLLRISQPALSFQIRTLENRLNRKLFQKSGRAVSLTKDGMDLYRLCERMFGISDEIVERFHQQALPGKSSMRIGVTWNIERPFVTEAVAAAIRAETGVLPFVSMESGKHQDLVEKLQLKQLDLVVTDQPYVGEDLTSLAILELPVFLLIHRKLLRGISKPARQGLKKWFSSSGVRLVLPSSRIVLRKEIDSFLEKTGVHAPVIFESDILASVSRGISVGIGVGFLPSQYLFREIQLKWIEKVGPPSGLWKHRFYLLGNRKRYGSSLEKAIISTLQRVT